MGDVLSFSSLAGADPREDTSSRRLVLEFYDREYVSLVRYICFLNVNAETAKEIAQDCFIKLHEHLEGGGDTSNLRAWLYRVAHNLARNSQLSARARTTSSFEDAIAVMEPVANEQTAEERVLEIERMVRFRTAMAKLPEAQREALVLRAQDLKYREIAQALGLSISTVAENIQRGMEALKKALA
jgi:RNA polymerase sigma-70 factor, ECF subfamily